MKILLDVSAHGFGHLSQVCSLLRALMGRVEDLQVTFRTALPAERIAEHYPFPFEHVEQAVDIGMVMADSIKVLVAESLEAYQLFHRDWDHRVEQQVAELQRLAPDVLISNVAYLGLAAAGRAEIPAYAFCSLNWADILAGYLQQAAIDTDESRQILQQIHDAYNAARCFIRPEPAMPMLNMHRRHPVGPVGRRGKDHSRALREQLGLSAEVKLGLLSMGGIATELPVAQWPVRNSIHWLVHGWHAAAPQLTPVSELGYSFIDLLASVDLVVCKPGYGTFVEASLAGKPVLYLPRGDWPEEPYLIEWLNRHGRASALTPAEFASGEFEEDWRRLLAMPLPPVPGDTGAEEAADIILGDLLEGDAPT